jgi:hypothetical protein
MKILQTPTFSKQVKKLHANQKKDLDLAITTVIDNPAIGALKKGDLNGFKSTNSAWSSNSRYLPMNGKSMKMH